MTLNEDFYGWWSGMDKYKDREIEARDKFGNVKVKERNPRGADWPGEETNIQYWVMLSNGYAVGMKHEKNEETGRYKRYAEFPYVKVS